MAGGFDRRTTARPIESGIFKPGNTTVQRKATSGRVKVEDCLSPSKSMRLNSKFQAPNYKQLPNPNHKTATTFGIWDLKLLVCPVGAGEGTFTTRKPTVFRPPWRSASLNGKQGVFRPFPFKSFARIIKYSGAGEGT